MSDKPTLEYVQLPQYWCIKCNNFMRLFPNTLEVVRSPDLVYVKGPLTCLICKVTVEVTIPASIVEGKKHQ